MEALTKLRASLLVNTLRHTQYHELCELLGGYHNEHWRELVFGNGEPRLKSPEPWLFVDGQPVQPDGQPVYDYAMVRRTHYDGDYFNYVLAQVSPLGSTGWEFVLFYNTGANDWVPEQMYSWGERCPTEGEAGTVVDQIEFIRSAAAYQLRSR